MNHHGTQSRLTSLPMRMCMRICYVHYCCQPTPQLQNYSNGAAAMTGRLSGLTIRVKEVASECESKHCVINREMLATSDHLNGRNMGRLKGTIERTEGMPAA
uniref:Uncharacterized protein n=1 Tax=Xenopus tropicalis TaxID=8364 RepID=A0A803J2V7_XENTR